MNAAFIVTLDVESVDPNSLSEVAFDVEQALLDGGQVVISVAPWSRHSGPSSLSSIVTALPTPNTNPITPIEPL